MVLYFKHLPVCGSNSLMFIVCVGGLCFVVEEDSSVVVDLDALEDSFWQCLNKLLKVSSMGNWLLSL